MGGGAAVPSGAGGAGWAGWNSFHGLDGQWKGLSFAPSAVGAVGEALVVSSSDDSSLTGAIDAWTGSFIASLKGVQPGGRRRLDG